MVDKYEQPSGVSTAWARSYVYGNGIDEVLGMFLPEHTGEPDDLAALRELAEAWLSEENDANWDPTYDYTSDKVIDFNDFTYYASVWDVPDGKETRFYYLKDALGSTIGIVGGRYQRESDREFYLYDVYGQPLQDSLPSMAGNPYLFTGRRYDPEVGLCYFRARHYDPSTGRFLQTDPIDYADSMNLYEYVLSNPTNWLDPYGLSTEEDETISDKLNTGISGPSVSPTQTISTRYSQYQNYSSRGQGPIKIDQIHGPQMHNRFMHQKSYYPNAGGRFASKADFEKQAAPKSRVAPGSTMSVAGSMAFNTAVNTVATYGYMKYVKEFEEGIRKTAKHFSWCRRLQVADFSSGEDEMCRRCPAGNRPVHFKIIDNDGETIHVRIRSHLNACVFEAWKVKQNYDVFWPIVGWMWPQSHLESEFLVVSDGVKKDCEAYCRDPKKGCR
ncbi:MAG: RHS repeat-associated core domain-containing protein [Sedimentisphaerales bacterium]|nr:RHS repeat-associated core domain-containing protein [Sedimentisphaerales bacterium]